MTQKITVRADKKNKDNIERFRSRLHKASLQISDLSIPLKKIGMLFLKSRKHIFERTGKGPYSDLTPVYKARKKIEFGFVYPILLATGRLRKSITRKGGENIFEVGKKRLSIGTKVPYGQYLDEGTSKMKRRPFLFWGGEKGRRFANSHTKTFNKHMNKALMDYVEKRMAKTLKGKVIKKGIL